MVSHKKFGGIDLSVGAGGLRFKKRPSGFNIRVGKCMQAKGASPRGEGRYSGAFQKAFVECVQSEGGKLTSTTKAKFRL